MCIRIQRSRATVKDCTVVCSTPIGCLENFWFCRKFSFEVIWGMISPYDSR